MRTFWTLVGYEYRKIFRRRVTLAALVLAGSAPTGRRWRWTGPAH